MKAKRVFLVAFLMVMLAMVAHAQSNPWNVGNYTIPGQSTSAAPALAVFNNTLYCVYKANDSTNNVIVTGTSDGKSWNTAYRMPNQNTSVPIQSTTAGPALAVFNNTLYCVYKANDSTNSVIVTSTSDGASWNTAYRMPGQSTSAGPALAVFNNILYCVYKTNDSSNSIFVTGTGGKQTQLSLTNSSNTDVTVYLTLGAVNGCTPNVNVIPFVTNYVNTLQGWFTLQAGKTVSYTPPLGTCFNGNIAFGSAPLNCPPAAYPSGINLFEFMLNNSLQGAGAQETIDISCVAGANAYIAVTMSGGGTWNAGPGYPNVTTFKNNNLCNNSGQVGVYPYACDNCTASVNPPKCSNPPICPIIPQKTAICNVQRNASNSGGTVNVNFTGWINPQPQPQPQTQLSLTNSSNTDVTVYLTLGAVNGCTPNVKLIPFVTNYVNTLQGSFTLKQGETVSYTPPLGTCFNGNIAFGSAPLNCAPTAYPSGINLFEFMLNNSLQGANAQETIDISCVAGANAYILVNMSGGGNWNAGPGYPNVTTFKNNKIGSNAGQVGVYPYACDNCTASVNPPQCPPPPLAPVIPQKTAICNVQRNASKLGGIVQVFFTGWIK